MEAPSSRAASAVQAALDQAGAPCRVRELPASTRSAQEAAAAIGCTVAQIAKSIVLRTEAGEPVLVIASGINRIDLAKVAKIAGQPVARADADFVRKMTGFAIGGVPPVGHRTPPRVILDQDLQTLDAIWAAAGTPNAVFPLDPALLQRITGGTWQDIREG